MPVKGTPDHNFCAFDVGVNGAFLDIDVFLDLLKCAGFPLVTEPILRGSFADCRALGVDSFCTT